MYFKLKLSQRTQPQAGAGQVLVSMRASSLNFRDLVVPERGYGNYTGELPLIPISDGMGVVSAVGPGVTRVKVGDRVCPTYFQSWQGGDPDLQRLTQSLGGPIDGTMTETMCLSEQGVVMVPDYLTDLQASTLPNYREQPEWAKATRGFTQGRGYDLILELGGEKTLPQSLRCIRPGGTLAMIGILSGSSVNTSLGHIITRQVRLQGVTVGHRDGMEAMLRAMAQHRIVPVVDKVFAFEELKVAMAYLRSGAQFGKVCIQH